MPSCLACGKRVAEDWRKLCPKCWVDQERAQVNEVARLKRVVQMREGAYSDIPSDRLRALIQHCHPDKHGGSPAAGEITGWLLKMRGE